MRSEIGTFAPSRSPRGTRRGRRARSRAANARSASDLADLPRSFCEAHRDHRLECFIRDDGALDAELRGLGFSGPPFFVEIGPLVEWRKGPTGVVGRTPRTECLSWF